MTRKHTLLREVYVWIAKLDYMGCTNMAAGSMIRLDTGYLGADLNGSSTICEEDNTKVIGLRILFLRTRNLNCTVLQQTCIF